MIQRILDEEGVPQELIHLAQAESGFIPRAVSRAAAGGMWQFLMWRGNEYGLKQTRYTDERMDPGKGHPRRRPPPARPLSTNSATGTWRSRPTTAAPGRSRRPSSAPAMRISGNCASSGVLPAETTNYVPIILAMTIMEKNAAEYGLEGFQLDPPLEYDTVELTAPTSLTLVSDIPDTPLTAACGPQSGRAAEHRAGRLLAACSQRHRQAAGRRPADDPAEHRGAWRMHRVGDRRDAGEHRQALRHARRRVSSPPTVWKRTKRSKAIAC